MLCDDPFIGYLKSIGYSAIRLPRADIRPLQLIARGGKDLDRLGELSNLMVSEEEGKPPPLLENVPSASVSGKRSADLRASIGLTLLDTVIGAMGGSRLGLEASFSSAKTIAFEFRDVLEDRIDIVTLDRYLATADVSPDARGVGQLLDADAVYAITATLKSTTFTVEVRDKSNQELPIDIPAVQGVVGGKVKISANSERSAKLSFTGTVPLVFGFQAVQMMYSGGRYTCFRSLPAGQAAMRGLGDDEPALDLFATSAAFARLGA